MAVGSRANKGSGEGLISRGRWSRLSPELDDAIWRLECKGWGSRRIARELHVSLYTVKLYRRPELRERLRERRGVRTTRNVRGSLRDQLSFDLGED